MVRSVAPCLFMLPRTISSKTCRSRGSGRLAVKAALPKFRELVPPDIHIALAFDQSVYVTHAIGGLVTEGVLGAVLTSLMVLLLLGRLRSALIVIVTIPLSVQLRADEAIQ